MEKQTVTDIKLKPRKKNFMDKLKSLFADRKKRYLYMFLFMLPFVIAILIFGIITYKEAKSLIGLATGTTEINPDYQIASMNYVLRDNATDVQKEYFAELKQAIEVDEADDSYIAGLICKNYVADFYTWSNKQGQYDVGGLYYIYSGSSELGDFKNLTYTQARDGFYQYLNYYINQYGSENLLEVENVEVVKANSIDGYYVRDFLEYQAIDEESSEKIYADFDYPAYEVTCKWSYKQNDKFDTSKYATSMNFIVVYRNDRFEISEASESAINVEKVEIEESES